MNLQAAVIKKRRNNHCCIQKLTMGRAREVFVLICKLIYFESASFA